MPNVVTACAENDRVRLPNAELAEIDPAKVRSYLLSPFHPLGRFKARFFFGLGYSTADWELLIAHLKGHALEGEAEPVALTKFGLKYRVDGMLPGPSGRTARVAVMWIVLRGWWVPRRVTALPGELP